MSKTPRSLLCAGLIACQFSCLTSHAVAVQDPVAAQATEASPKRTGEVVLLVGQRNLDSGDWSPVEDQTAFGLEGNVRLQGQNLSFDVGLQGSTDDSVVFDPSLGDVRVTGRTGEIYAGPRYNIDFENAPLSAFLGGGLTVINAWIEGEQLSTATKVDDDDWSAGGYLHAGLLVHIAEAPGSVHAVLGVDLRTVFATDVTLFDVSGDADYTQIAVIVGLGL